LAMAVTGVVVGGRLAKGFCLLHSIRREYIVKKLLLAASLSVAALAACEKPQTAAPKPGPVPVGVVTVRSQKISVTSELPGRTSPYKIAEVRPQINGIVQQRLFREGADVKAGETLYQIDPAVYQAALDSASASLAKAEANLATAKIRADRYSELVRINAVSKQDFDDATAAFKQAEADVAAGRAAVAAARINLGYTRITSPISGLIGISTVTPGALLTANQTVALTTVQQLDPIYVDVVQPGAELIRMKHALESGARVRGEPVSGSELAPVWRSGRRGPLDASGGAAHLALREARSVQAPLGRRVAVPVEGLVVRAFAAAQIERARRLRHEAHGPQARRLV
jgi:multidrug efflux pump subunit AcrA (membrane-fusion protein)